MKVLNISNYLSRSEVIDKVVRFIMSNQYSLPVTINHNDINLIIMILEDKDFRFKIVNNDIIVTS
jgi:hypothetical protein